MPSLTENYEPEWNPEDDPDRRIRVLTVEGQKAKIGELNVDTLVIIKIFTDVRVLGQQHRSLRVRVIKADSIKKTAQVQTLSGGNGQDPVKLLLPWTTKPTYIIDIAPSNIVAGLVNRALMPDGPNPFWPETWVRPEDYTDHDAWDRRIREVVHGAFGIPVRPTDTAPRAAHEFGAAVTDHGRILTDLHALAGQGEGSFGAALIRAENEVDCMAKYFLRLQGKSIDAYMNHPDRREDRGAAFRAAMEVPFRRTDGAEGDSKKKGRPSR